MTILSLITNPIHMPLEPTLVNKIAKETGGEINWLAQNTACEIISPQTTNISDIISEIIGNHKIDINILPSQNRRKKLLIADMDSTMIEQECIDELADALGLKEKVAAITKQAMNGELDFAQALKTRVKLLKGLNKKIIEEVRNERISLTSGGRALVQTMKTYGAHTILISGGFTIFADYIGKRIGFTEIIANQLEFSGDILTGTVKEPIIDSSAKLSHLQNIAKQMNISLEDTLAVGDGANDLPMIKVAGLGVAMHAKPIVAKEADIRINHADLTALLYLQGYNEEEIIR